MANVNALRRAMEQRNTSVDKLAAEAGMNRATLYRKMKSGDFRILEAKKISNALGLTKEDAFDIFFAFEVA